MRGLFVLTIFLGSSLLFLVQPMFAKMVLPALGGTPTVWNTCMVFCQASLLAGYAYAHVTTRRLGVRRQALMHLGVLLAPLAVLPLRPPGGAPSGDESPTGWLLATLVGALGLPFFAVSTAAPLLQRWFAATDHPDADRPYFLYAASNTGSMLALLAYPLVIEPRLTLAQQGAAWTLGYLVLAALTAACAAVVRLRGATAAARPVPEDVPPAPLGWPRVLRWLALAALPSSLLLGVTTYVTAEIGSVPLLWVVPLALYLATFILVFAERPPLPRRWISAAAAVLAPALALSTTMAVRWELVPLHLLGFFALAMACHGALAADRPPARQLTAFYLWMAAGGALGGLFNALIAPLVFRDVWEYPLVLAAGVALLPGRRGGGIARWKWDRALDLAAPVLAAEAAWFLWYGAQWRPGEATAWGVLALLVLLCLSQARRPVRCAFCVAAAWGAGVAWDAARTTTLLTERTFFGVLRVARDAPRRRHNFFHGATLHGFQSLDPAQRCDPSGYYDRTGPIAQALAAARRADGRRQEVAILGLGTGALACHGAPGRRFTFFEIDPAVLAIASDPRYFRFLSDCAPDTVRVVLGDGRLALAREPDGFYGVIEFDAFSSDSIPIHLLTRQALEMYLTKLAPDGILIFHISNRYLDLAPPLGRLAAELGLAARVRRDEALTAEERRRGKIATVCVVMARSPADLKELDRDLRWPWVPVDLRGAGPAWTDESSDLLQAISWE